MKLSGTSNVLMLSSVPFIMVLGNTMLFPNFPEMAKDLEITRKQLSYLVLAISLPSAFLAPFTGILADRWGRKTILVPSLLIYGLGGLVSGLSVFLTENPYLYILLGRVIQGLGSAGPMHLATVMAGDLFQDSERIKAVGYLETANASGKVVSPLLGSIVGLIGWYAPFFVYPLLSVPVALAVWVTIKDTRREPTPHFNFKALKNITTPHNIMGLLSGFFTLFLLFETLFWLSDISADQLELNRLLRGFIISLPVIVVATVSTLAERFEQKLHPKGALTLGLIILALAVAALPILFKSFWLWPLLIAIGIGVGLILPTLDLISTSQIGSDGRATITSAYSSIRSLGAAIAPFSFAILNEISMSFSFWLPASLTILTALASWKFINTDELEHRLL